MLGSWDLVGCRNSECPLKNFYWQPATASIFRLQVMSGVSIVLTCDGFKFAKCLKKNLVWIFDVGLVLMGEFDGVI